MSVFGQLRWSRITGRFRRLPVRTRAAASVLVAAVFAAAGFGVFTAASNVVAAGGVCMRQGATILDHKGPDGECVGFTDGAFSLDPALTTIEHDIADANRAVVQGHAGDYVCVVYLLPISSASGSIMPMNAVLDQLRGALAAQTYVNNHDVGGVSPYICILIGNLGRQANQYEAADQIIQSAAASQHIVAVAGIGVSLSTTIATVSELARPGPNMLPVVGSTITAREFDNIRDMIRVAPSGVDSAAVARSFAQQAFSRAVLVEDQNSKDSYDVTLVNGLKGFGDAKHQIISHEVFDTTFRNEPSSAADEAQAEEDVRNRISEMPGDICIAQNSASAAQPAVVLFGGRAQDLADLVAAMADRPCLNTPITIVSGNNVTSMALTAAVRRGLASKITIDYAGLADPQEWAPGQGVGSGGSVKAFADGQQGFAAFIGGYRTLYPGGPAPTGESMLAYDSMLTVTTAIRLTTDRQPTPSAVAGELPALQGANIVLGSSGPCAFEADYANSAVGSDPIGKALPVLTLASDGSQHFVSLQWPNGPPPAS